MPEPIGNSTVAGLYGDWVDQPLAEVGPTILQAVVETHGDDGPWQAPKPGSFAKWLASSALQKSIRRGNLDAARYHCDQLLQIDSSYMMRRLNTVAAEDIGVAGLLAMAAYAMGGNLKSWQAKMGGEKVVMRALVTEMVASPKCRLGDEIKTLDYREWSEAEAEAANLGIAELTDKNLLAMLADKGATPPQRAMALMYYTGFEPSDRNVLVPRKGRKNWRHALMDVCDTLETPTLIRELCWVYAGRMMERQAYLLPLAWEFAKNQPFMVEDDPGIVDHDIGKWPAAGLDGHTSVGKNAIKQMIKRDALTQELCEAHVLDLDDAKQRAVHLTLFRTEGHLCRQRLTFPLSAQIRKRSSIAVVSHYCLDDGVATLSRRKHGEAMLLHGPELLDRMNLFRQKIMS